VKLVVVDGAVGDVSIRSAISPARCHHRPSRTLSKV